MGALRVRLISRATSMKQAPIVYKFALLIFTKSKFQGFCSAYRALRSAINVSESYQQSVPRAKMGFS